MNNKIEGWIRKAFFKGTKKADNIPLETKEKIFNYYIKGLDFVFKVITSVVVSGTFLWFIPTKLGVGWERTTVICLVVIILYLRFGKINVS